MDPPSFAHWVKRVEDIRKMEQLTMLIQWREGLYQVTIGLDFWPPWSIKWQWAKKYKGCPPLFPPESIFPQLFNSGTDLPLPTSSPSSHPFLAQFSCISSNTFSLSVDSHITLFLFHCLLIKEMPSPKIGCKEIEGLVCHFTNMTTLLALCNYQDLGRCVSRRVGEPRLSQMWSSFEQQCYKNRL